MESGLQDTVKKKRKKKARAAGCEGVRHTPANAVDLECEAQGSEFVSGSHMHTEEEEEEREPTDTPTIREESGARDTVTSPPEAQECSNSVASRNKKKKKKLPSVAVPESQESSSQASLCTSSFQEELEWCIGRLELSMLRTGASKSQKQHGERSLRTLRGSKTPLPKKRQLMRSVFGDYRSKMRTHPTPGNLVTKEARTETAQPAVVESVGTFYKRCTHAVKGVDSHDPQQEVEEFKFDFNISVQH